MSNQQQFRRGDGLVKAAVHGVTVNAYVVLEPELRELESASAREKIFFSLCALFLGPLLGGGLDLFVTPANDPKRNDYVWALCGLGLLSAICLGVGIFEWRNRAGLLSDIKKRASAAKLTGIN
jgi:hypothetical protein